jgi:hypothetical protein
MVQGGVLEKQQCILEEAIQFTSHKVIAPYLRYTDKMLYFGIQQINFFIYTNLDYKNRCSLSVFQRIFRKKIPHSLVTVTNSRFKK